MKLTGEKILIGTSSFAALDKAPLVCLRQTGCEVVDNPVKRRLTRPELIDLLATGITGLIAGMEVLDREALEKSQLRVISRCGSGISNVDIVSAKKLGIKVCYTPDAPTGAVAELTLGAMLSLLRMIPEMNRDLHNGRWNKKVGLQLEGKTVAIIGYGRIGKRFASLLRPFGVSIIAVDPALREDGNVETLPLDEALGMADIITIHSGGEAQIIGEKEFRLMKKGVILLNAARGNLVCETSLVTALEKGLVRGAWLDVFNDEPYNGPLKEYPQVILTPHVGSYTLECRKQMEMQAVNNLIKAFGEDT
ncbi:MAG: hydroxyacid dehydrogenase [Omnitrophica bacterium]|nr:hydroxyacid dehydrogenase [Candidatus Omnitrophota bacterium]